MTKRIISLLLSVVLVLSMILAPALAAEVAESEPVETIISETAAASEIEAAAEREAEAPMEEGSVVAATAAVETQIPEIQETEAPEIPETEEIQSQAAAEAAASGSFGDGLNWTLEEDGLLTISGTGSMGDYTSGSSIPWYNQRAQIQSVVIEAGVTDICDYAFNNCSNLTRVTLPESITAIGQRAFYSCSTLTEVAVPANVTAVGKEAFSYCSKLASVSLPEGLTSVGERAFYYDRKLTTVNFPSTLASIEKWAFGCCGMTSVVLPEGVATIGELAFEACSNLEYVILPATLTSIGKSAFNSCEELISINLPEGLTSIGSNAFNYCRSLKSITLPEGITEIADYTFRSCYSLTGVTIPSTVTSIGTEAFSGCMNLEGSLVFPEGLTSIGGSAFNGCSLTAVTLPSTLTSLGRSAFYGNDFAEIVIPEGIAAIADYLFTYCANLTSVTLPSTVTAIGAEAFSGCASLTEFMIPAAVTSIGGGAFSDCEKLAAIYVEEGNSVYASQDGVLFTRDMATLMQYPSGKTDSAYTIPATVTVLNDNAFYGNTTLERIVIPGTVTTVGESVFEYCTNLASVTLEEGVAELGYMAFGYSGIESIIFPESLTILGDCAFFVCERLEKVTIGANVTSIGSNVFDNCARLTAIDVAEENMAYASDDGVLMDKAKTEIIQFPSAKTSYVIPETVTALNQDFQGCTSLTSITIPGTITSFGTFAFSGCTALTEVTIKEGTTTIGYGAFYGCNALPAITIPASVTVIDNVAFSGCSAMKEIHFLGDAPVIKFDAFGSSDPWYDSKVSATAYYPPDNETWTADVRQNYGGNLVWLEEGSVELIAMGSCGDNATWSLDVNNKLTISGTGEMTACRSASVVPWYSYMSTITDVVVEEGITTLSAYAFQRAGQLEGVTLPGTLTVIGESAFAHCTALETIVIPGSVVTIERYAFQICEKLTAVTLNEGLETIGSYAFTSCRNLPSISIPGTVASVGEEAFFDCIVLEDVILSPATVNIGRSAFGRTPWYEKQLNDSGFVIINNVLLEYTGEDTTVTIPEGVVSIGSGVFSGFETLTEVVIPETVTSIQEKAFYNCSALKKVTIPDGVTAIDEKTFFGCASLERVSLPESLLSIGEHAFLDCTSLTSIALPEGLQIIGEQAFSGCSSLAGVTMTEGLKTIGNRAFWNCISLTTIHIPDSVTAIGDRAFSSCSALANIRIGSGLRELAYGVFENCISLEVIQIPKNITYIRGNAFWGCTKLTDVVFGSTISVFGGVEDDWEDEEEVIPGVGTALEIYSGAFGSCERLEEMQLPGYLTYLHPDTYRGSLNTAFYQVNSVAYTNDAQGCIYKNAGKVLTCVPAKLSGAYVISADCTGVEADFYGCSQLTSITFPTAVGGIRDEDAFAGCTSLLKVTAGENNTQGYRNDDSGALIWKGGYGSYVCFIPANITEYTIPADAVRINNAAFANAKLSAIHVAQGNTAFSSHDGVLFSADATVLKLYPSAKTDNSFVIPAAVEEIADYAFAGVDALKELWFAGEPFYVSSYIFGGDVFESIGGAEDPDMTCWYPENISYWPEFIYELGYLFSEKVQLKPYLLYTTDSEAAIIIQTGKPLAVRSRKNIGGLTGVTVDGKTVAASNYTVSENGNFILLRESYLENLVTGDHKILLKFADGDERIDTEDNAMSQDEFEEALAQATANGEAYVLTSAIVLERDLNAWAGLWRLKVSTGGSITVPDNVTLHMDSEFCILNGSVYVEKGGTLVLSGGYADFTSGAQLIIAQGGRLILEEGECYIERSDIFNQGTITIGENTRLVNGGIITNEGEVKILGVLLNDSGAAIENNGTIARSGEFYNYGSFSGNAVTEIIEPEYAVVISGPTRVISGESITLTAQILPENLTGTSVVWSLADPADRDYVTLSGGKITAKAVDRLRTVTVVASAKDGSAEAASVEISVLPKATALAIFWENGVSAGDDSTMYHDLNDPDAGTIILRAAAVPESASNDVEWTVKTSKGSQKIVNADNTVELDPTGLTGSITVTAKALDGSNKTDKLTIKLVKLPRQIHILNVQAHIRGGSRLSLSTDIDADKSLTSRNVVWSLVDDVQTSSSAYASVTAKGKLSTRAVSVPTLIKVRASVQENPDIFDTVDITLYPAVDAVQILHAGENVTGGTMTADPEDGSLILNAAFLPNGCMEEGTWTTSDKKNAYASYEENEDGSLLVNPTGKNGTVTITFKADDGSGKSAKVKIKLTNLAQTVTLSASEGQLRSGQSLTLKAAVIDAEGKTPSSTGVTWTSSDPAIATVSNGRVKAKTVYENTIVTITATAKDGSGASASAQILIRPKLNRTLGILRNGQNVTGSTYVVNLDSQESLNIAALMYDCTADSYENTGVTLNSSSKKVADVDVNGNLTLLKTGKTTITAKSGSQTAKVTVQVVRFADQVTVTGPDGWLLSGKTMSLKASVTAKNGTPSTKTVTWSSDNPSVATVSSSGRVKAQKVYERTTVTITAMAKDGSGVHGEYTLTVYPAATTVSIQSATYGTLDNRTISVSLTEELRLTAVVYPWLDGKFGAMQQVTWTSSNKAVAGVDADGTVKMLKKGTVTIKATTTDGSKKSVSFKLTVLDSAQ